MGKGCHTNRHRRLLGNDLGSLRRTVGICLALLVLAAASAINPVSSAAHPGHGHEGTQVNLRTALGEAPEAIDSGKYLVDSMAGAPIYTHGPDLTPDTENYGFAADRFGPGAPELGLNCANSWRQQVVYAYPVGSPDRSAEVAAEVRAAMRRMNAVLNSASLESGGGSASYRVACDQGGEISILTLPVPSLGLAEVIQAARAAGLEKADTDFTVFVDAESKGSCGIASLAFDDRPGADNPNNQGGGYALVYRDCWETEAVMHEVSHTQGAVQASAPHSTGNGGHCNQEVDVVCYIDGGDRNQDNREVICTDEVKFDCGYDDYFDAAPEPGEYLESHWNLGSSQNRFIDFSAPPKGGSDASGPQGSESSEDPGTDGAEKTQRLRRKLRTAAPSAGEWMFFEHKPRRHAKSVTIKLRGQASATTSLFVRSKRTPSAKRFDCQAPDTGAASCTVKPRRGKKLVVGVLGRQTASGLSASGQKAPKLKIKVRSKTRKPS